MTTITHETYVIGPKLTATSETLLTAASANGMCIAYGYIGLMGHFNVVMVCVNELRFLPYTGFENDTVTITCDENGEWHFA